VRDDDEGLHAVRGGGEGRVAEVGEVLGGRRGLARRPDLRHPDRREAGGLGAEHLGLRDGGVGVLGHVRGRADHQARSTRERGRRERKRRDRRQDPREHPDPQSGHGYASPDP
jgi:hypothetical protein